jgi:hypothetical protein
MRSKIYMHIDFIHFAFILFVLYFFWYWITNLIRTRRFKKKVVEIEKATEADANLEDSYNNVSQHLIESDEQHHDHSNKPPVT